MPNNPNPSAINYMEQLRDYFLSFPYEMPVMDNWFFFDQSKGGWGIDYGKLQENQHSDIVGAGAAINLISFQPIQQPQRVSIRGRRIPPPFERWQVTATLELWRNTQDGVFWQRINDNNMGLIAWHSEQEKLRYTTAQNPHTLVLGNSKFETESMTVMDGGANTIISDGVYSFVFRINHTFDKRN
jgi:hypothetical protein